AVEHVFEIEYPGRWRVQDVAFENFDANDGHEHDDQPGKCLADPSADAVDRMKDALNVHLVPLPGGYLGTTKHHSVFGGMVPCQFRFAVRSASLRSDRSSG